MQQSNDHLMNSDIQNSSSSSPTTISLTTTTILPIYEYIHINQLMEWDCGLACINMILLSSYRNSTNNKNTAATTTTSSSLLSSSTSSPTSSLIYSHNYHPTLLDLHNQRKLQYPNNYQSIWTIDIVQLLYEYRIPCIFYTCELGIMENYQILPFYSSNFTQDSQRIPYLFSQLLSVVPIKKVSYIHF